MYCRHWRRARADRPATPPPSKSCGVVPVRLGADALGGAVNLVTDQQYETHAGFSYQVGSFGTHRASLDGRWRREPTGFVLGATAFLDVAENDYRVDVQIPDERGRLFAATVPRSHDGYDAYGVTQQPELGSG
jgi:hypothetical protein